MKKIGEYTCRGFVDNATTEIVKLFDGRFDTAYKITKFEAVIYDPDNSGVDGFCTLATAPLDPSVTTDTQWRFADRKQIGWSSMTAVGAHTGPNSAQFNLVDRENMVVEDLYIYAEMNAAGGGMNYYIEMDKYDITDWEGALTMARNKVN